jgi:hypothetical protein
VKGAGFVSVNSNAAGKGELEYMPLAALMAGPFVDHFSKFEDDSIW